MKNQEESARPPKEDKPISDAGWFARNHWTPYVLPMFVFMALGYFEPKPPVPQPSDDPFQDDVIVAGDTDASGTEPEGEAATESLIPYDYYPWVYTGRILLTLVVLALAWKTYRSFPLRVSPLSAACGFAGVVLWIGICSLGLEETYILPHLSFLFGEDAGRAAYNPLEQLKGQPLAMISFLGVRFIGLALLVPLIEEFFLRGFLVRFVQKANWWALPIGAVTAAGWAAVIIYAALTHPGEMIAAVLWFSMVTLLVVSTKNIWDAVIAHIVTNLLLGIYVVTFGAWELW